MENGFKCTLQTVQKERSISRKASQNEFGHATLLPPASWQFHKTENTHKTNANPPKNTPGPTPPEPRKWDQNNPKMIPKELKFCKLHKLSQQ